MASRSRGVKLSNRSSRTGLCAAATIDLVEDRVGVDVALDIRAVRSTTGQSTADGAQIGGRAS